MIGWVMNKVFRAFRLVYTKQNWPSIIRKKGRIQVSLDNGYDTTWSKVINEVHG